MDLARKKPDLTVIIGGGKHGPPPEADGEEEEMGQEEEGSPELEAMAQEAIDAVKAEDASGFASAIQAMVSACQMR